MAGARVYLFSLGLFAELASRYAQYYRCLNYPSVRQTIESHTARRRRRDDEDNDDATNFSLGRAKLCEFLLSRINSTRSINELL